MPEGSEVASELASRAESLREQLKGDRAQLEQIRRKVQLEEKILQAVELLLQVERGLPPDTGPATTTEPARRPTITEAVASVLVEHGHPMHADEVMEELQRRGMELSEKDPKATVVTALVRGTRRGVFVRTAPNTFRIARPGEGGEA